MISREVSRAVAEFAFRQAERMQARVFGGPKYTVSPIYEGMFKEEMDAAAQRHPAVRYEPQLIDATLALLLTTSGDPLVIPALNRDGDILSDLVLQLFGSLAGAESLLLSFDQDFQTKVVMAEAPHGTAPRLFGKNLANPMAMILAAGSLLEHFPDDEQADSASQAISDAVFGVAADGIRTVDLGGHVTTSEFTDAVIERVRQLLRHRRGTVARAL
jgi:isocitrate/isopropylmalate dehydrogenase